MTCNYIRIRQNSGDPKTGAQLHQSVKYKLNLEIVKDVIKETAIIL